jgi:hypothetical protein
MAKDIQAQINESIADFAQQLERLVRDAAVEAVKDALGGGSGMMTAPRRTKASSSKAGAKKVTRRAGKKRGKRGGRRGGATVDPQTVLSALAKEDGQRINQLVASLGANQDALKVTLTELLAEKQIDKKGKARGTTYHLRRK